MAETFDRFDKRLCRVQHKLNEEAPPVPILPSLKPDLPLVDAVSSPRVDKVEPAVQ